MKQLLIFLIGLFLVTSCVSRTCNVKINKKKFEYYNKLQYGGNTYVKTKKKGR